MSILFLLKFAPVWPWLDTGWFGILSPYLEPVHLRVQLQRDRASGDPLPGNSTAVVDSSVSGAPEDVLYFLSLVSPKPDLAPALPENLLLSGRGSFQDGLRFYRPTSNLSIRESSSSPKELPESTTRGYAAVVDLCLKGSKDQRGHPSASEESRRASKYPEGKRAFQIRSGARGLVWLARADYSHAQLGVGRSRRACFTRTGHPWIVKSGSRLVCD
ncbi:hypothetical protein RF11_02741 [Thelohanellus kitauei]|uniref:Uncharacterized protein n=1 Tax=Thelohanellus kitauei TaxID=669202 RepID=A0A0C2MDU5_THEKT|nr:hypothetical protein RF11_02741 [Thelohanellus kitauei]